MFLDENDGFSMKTMTFFYSSLSSFFDLFYILFFLFLFVFCLVFCLFVFEILSKHYLSYPSTDGRMFLVCSCTKLEASTHV